MSPTTERRSHWYARALLLLLALAGVTACSGTPQEFSDRRKLPTCGTVDAGLPFAIPDRGKACLERAKSSAKGSELVVLSFTVEGDPIRRYFRYESGTHALVVWEDASDDKFGGDTDWTRYQCESVPSLDRWFEGVCTHRSY